MKTAELSSKCFISQPTEKKCIVIHGSNSRTEYSPEQGRPGSAKNVIANWNLNREKFASAYLIDRDGTITETFDDKFWSFHLNINNSYGVWDKQSIGIELINEGPLVEDKGNYYINKYPSHQNLYKGPILKQSFRGYDYYADVSKTQGTVLVDLLKHLSAKHNIFPVFQPSLEFDSRVWDKATIFTHSVVNRKVTDIPLNPKLIEQLQQEFRQLQPEAAVPAPEPLLAC